MTIDIHVGDCLDIFRAIPPASLDAFITDPPAGVAFMGRAWDKDKGGRDAWIAYWAERLAVARAATKPGGWLLCWALPRTCGWTQMAIEDAGWFVTDTIHHAFGQGWPKGRAQLKPSHEVWFLARNGAGAELQIDASRVARGERMMPVPLDKGIANEWGGLHNRGVPEATSLGSWPANTLLSHSPECERAGCLAGCLACGASTLAPQGGPAPWCECGRAMVWACPVAEVDAQSGTLTSGVGTAGSAPTTGTTYGAPGSRSLVAHADSGGASRFFHCLPGDVLRYQAKASSAERDAGCEDLYWRSSPRNPFGFDRVTREEWEGLDGAGTHARGNVGPTVKSIALMENLCRLIVPAGGSVGNLCTGQGGTALAAQRLGLSFVGAEMCPEAAEIARARLAWWGARKAIQLTITGEEEPITPKPTKTPRERPAPEPAAPADDRTLDLFAH